MYNLFNWLRRNKNNIWFNKKIYDDTNSLQDEKLNNTNDVFSGYYNQKCEKQWVYISIKIKKSNPTKINIDYIIITVLGDIAVYIVTYFLVCAQKHVQSTKLEYPLGEIWLKLLKPVLRDKFHPKISSYEEGRQVCTYLQSWKDPLIYALYDYVESYEATLNGGTPF